MWGRWRGLWPGRGPFSYLPPRYRPGWSGRGRGACWWLFAPMYPPILGAPSPSPEDEVAELEAYRKGIEEEIKRLDSRIQELKKVIEEKKTLPVSD
ncbi:MAG: DUF5320 domain-containing protein [archaeon]|nr:DUF5320 domain-containing protein [archaeon]MCP8306745.1 DUF5320 domain-containing protein [archaeon]